MQISIHNSDNKAVGIASFQTNEKAITHTHTHTHTHTPQRNAPMQSSRHFTMSDRPQMEAVHRSD